MFVVVQKLLITVLSFQFISARDEDLGVGSLAVNLFANWSRLISTQGNCQCAKQRPLST